MEAQDENRYSSIIGPGASYKAKKKGRRSDNSRCLVFVRSGLSIPFGKDTAEIGKVLKVLSGLGLEITVSDRTWTDAV
jgi:hypothetical protein